MANGRVSAAMEIVTEPFSCDHRATLDVWFGAQEISKLSVDGVALYTKPLSTRSVPALRDAVVSNSKTRVLFLSGKPPRTGSAYAMASSGP